MAVSIFSQLPDDILKHIGNYWNDHKESVYRRIFKLETCETKMDSNPWKNPRSVIKKMMTMRLPQLYYDLTSTPDQLRLRVCLPEIKITKCMCVVKKQAYYARTVQFNFKKHTDKEYDDWINDNIKSEWKNVMASWSRILKKQYPAIYALAKAEVEKLYYIKTQEQIKQRHIDIQQAKEAREQKKKEEILHQAGLIKHFGTLPQYITSL
jgi:hypothetical protein